MLAQSEKLEITHHDSLEIVTVIAAVLDANADV
jgi:hypothetical protein